MPGSLAAVGLRGIGIGVAMTQGVPLRSSRVPPRSGLVTAMSNQWQDWIGVVEANYRLDGTEDCWLDELLNCAAPMLSRGVPPLAWSARYTAAAFEFTHFARRSSLLLKTLIRTGHRVLSPAVGDLIYRGGKCIGSATEEVFTRWPSERAKSLAISGGRYQDLLIAGGHSGCGQSVIFAAFSREPTRPSPIERKRWQQLSAHLGAGMRLRALGRSLSLDGEPVEAILDSSGKLHDARNEAVEPCARDALRAAVRRIEKSRSRAGRADPDAALDAWEGLVDGRWSLVDRFDSDGKRYVVALRNDSKHRDPRGLSLRERQVCEYIGMGRSSKHIAYTLGLSLSLINNCSLRAQRKLGLRSRAELAAFFSLTGLRARLAELAVRDQTLLVGVCPLIDEVRIGRLSQAEREVVAALVAGSTNADIARRRHSSERTVANQVQSVFRKLQVRSRSELAARLLPAS